MSAANRAVLLFAARLLRSVRAVSQPHDHEGAWQVEYVMAGPITYDVGGAEHRLGTGCLIAIPPGYRHRQESPRAADSYLLRFVLRGHLPAREPVVVALPPQDREEAERILESLVAEHDSRAKGREDMIDALLAQLVVWVKRWRATAGTGGAARPVSDAVERTRWVADMLRRRYADRFAIADLAKMACLSRSRFVQIFREEFGVAPGDFHRRVQMDKAVELAKHTGMSWQQIGLHLGYSDPSYFSRAFRKVMGAPPSKCLKRTRTTE